MNRTNMSNNDFYSVAINAEPLKTFSVILTILTSILIIPGMSGIIWYERFGTELKRILVNMLVSSFCWCGIVWYLFVMSLEVVRYVYGPLPDVVCFVHLVAKHTIHLQTVMICDAITFVRYIILFVMKNNSGFNDEFWNVFINVWITAFCALSQFTFLYLPGTQPLVFYICTGQNPGKIWEHPAKVNYVITVVIFVSAILQLIAGIKIIRYKIRKGAMAPRQEKIHIRNQICSDIFTSATFIFGASMFRLLSLKINNLSPELVNSNPNQILIFAQSFGSSLLACGSFTIFFYVRNQEIRSSLSNKIKELIFKNDSRQTLAHG